MISCDHFEGSCDLSVKVERNFVHQRIYSLTSKDSLDFGENCFDRIRLRLVRCVINWCDIKLLVPRLDFVGSVDVQPIHEHSDRAFAVFCPQGFQVHYEVISVDCLHVQLQVINPFLFGHTCDHRAISYVHFFLVNGKVTVLGRPFSSQK